MSDLVEPEDIVSLAGTQPPAQAAGRLVDLANARGGHDNITVVIVRVRESAQGTQPVAPTVVQTYVPEAATSDPHPPDPNPPAGHTTPPLPVAQKPLKGHLTLVVGLALAAVGVVTAIVVLWVGLSHPRSVHPEAGLLPAPTLSTSGSATGPSLTPIDVPEMAPMASDLPKLHRPDAEPPPDLK
jgi:hypothetical protein